MTFLADTQLEVVTSSVGEFIAFWQSTAQLMAGVFTFYVADSVRH
jgi:hypothetical protein